VVTIVKFLKEENCIFCMAHYVRCMSKEEANELKRTGKLCQCQEHLVPVFDSPDFVERRIKGMCSCQLKNYFERIGVRSPQVIAFFEVTNSRNVIGPIPQKNGLIEYKISEGTRVSPYDFIRI